MPLDVASAAAIHDAALHAQEQSVIRVTWIVHTILVDDAGIHQSA
jgi:hypothetical protein